MLGNAKFDTNTISQMTYAVVVEERDPADFAKEWVANNGDAVDSWLN
jgi:glycine betaine/proline transport system substrate-binding protein